MRHLALFGFALCVWALVGAPPSPPKANSIDIAKAPGTKLYSCPPYFFVDRSLDNKNWTRIGAYAGDAVSNSDGPAIWIADFIDDKANIATLRIVPCSKAEFDAAGDGTDSGLGHGIILYRR